MPEITKTQALPAPFIETLGKTFGEQLGRLAPQEIDTTKFQQIGRASCRERV